MNYTSLQIGRGLAALCVVLHHIVGKSHAAGIGLDIATWFNFGYLGVDYFFVLSGFIISHTIAQNKLLPWQFLIKRAIRLMPVFWLIFVVSLIGALAVPSVIGRELDYSVAELLKAALLWRQDISDGRSNPPIVGVAWTLHHEIYFYVIIAVYLVHRSFGLILGALILGSSLNASMQYPYSFLCNPLNFEFAFGVAAYWVHSHLNRNIAILSIVLGVIMVLVLPQYWRPVDGFVDANRVISFGLPFGIIVVGWATLDYLRGRHAATDFDQLNNLKQSIFMRAGVFLGNISYVLYLIHYPILLISLKSAKLLSLPNGLTVILYFATSLVASLAVSLILHLYFERPSQRWLEMSLGLNSGKVNRGYVRSSQNLHPEKFR